MMSRYLLSSALAAAIAAFAVASIDACTQDLKVA